MSVALNNEELTLRQDRRSLLASIDPGKSPWPTRLGLPLVLLSVLSGLATFVILTGLTPLQPSREIVILFLAVNGVLVALMALLISVQVWGLLAARRQQLAGSGLHVRIVALFSLIAAVPALMVALFAAVTLNRGLDAWFSERTRSIVDTAPRVAEAYIKEQGRDRARRRRHHLPTSSQQEMFDNDRQNFVKRVARHAVLRGLVGVFVFERAQAGRCQCDREQPHHVHPADAGDDRSRGQGRTVVIPPREGGNVVRALIKLQNFPSHYLYVYRTLNPVGARAVGEDPRGQGRI